MHACMNTYMHTKFLGSENLIGTGSGNWYEVSNLNMQDMAQNQPIEVI